MNLFHSWYHPEPGTAGKERNYFIDNLKFSLIILVIIGHFALKLSYVKEIRYLTYFIYVFHMPCFVFVSGFLAKRMNANGKLRADRILSILWMYLIFKFGNVMLGYAFGKHVSLSLFKDASAPWYLLALAVWYLFVPLLERIKNRYLIAGSFLIGLFAGYIGSIGQVFSLSRIFVFFPFFILGLCLSEQKLRDILDKRLRLPAAILLLLMLCLIISLGKHVTPISRILYATSPYSSALKGGLKPYGILFRSAWYVSAVLLSFAFMLLVPRCRLFFTKYGERTLQVYILHIWVRNGLAYLGFFSLVKSGPKYLPVLVLLGCIPLVFLLANKPLQKLFDALMATGLFKKLLKGDP